jgi:hypothetical protein
MFVALTATIAIAAAFWFIGTGYRLLREDNAWERCLSDPPGSNKPGSGRHLEWEWMPPRYYCVYTDRTGRVLGRDPATR